MKLKRRPKLKSPEPLDGLLTRAGREHTSPYSPAVSEEIWKQAVGARIAERAKPLTLERGVLTVRAATSVWASELSLLAESLILRLRSHGVVLTSLRFRVGAVEPMARPPERRASRKIPPPEPLPAPLSRSFAEVADESLREILTEAARSNLAWQKFTRGGGE